MKSILSATLAVHAAAITLPLDAETTFAQVEHLHPHSNQYHCDTLPKEEGVFHYEFNQEACACFFVFDIYFDPYCDESGLVWNPLHVARDMNTLCITQEEYDAIFDHGLGPDCWQVTADDEDEGDIDIDLEEDNEEINENEGEGEIDLDVDEEEDDDYEDDEGDIDLELDDEVIDENDKADDLDDEIEENDDEGEIDLEVDDDQIEEDDTPQASCDEGIDEFNCIQLTAHNKYRCAHGVPPLEYDSFLAKLA